MYYLKDIMANKLKKAVLLSILLATSNLCNAQTNTFFELLHYAINSCEYKNKAEILSVETEIYSIDSTSQDSFVMFDQLEYYDGAGNLVFLKIEETYDVRYWLKQLNASDQIYNIYTDGAKESHFSIESNDSAYQFEFFDNDSDQKLDIFIDTEKIQTRSDSVIIEGQFNDRGYFSQIKHKDTSGNAFFVMNLETLTYDEKGNWTSRIIKNNSRGKTYTYLKKRKINYADEYKITKYLELEIDSLIMDQQLIVDPELLNPDSIERFANSRDEEAIREQKFIYESALRLFYKKYFNDDYFFNFSFSENETKQVLNERLLKHLKTFVFDIKNKRFYRGRTNSKRWFDKTGSFNRMQEMESPPTITDKRLQINGYNCSEYVRLKPTGEKEIYYVTEELPFINYADFTFKLPGFILKSTRHLREMGAVTIVTNIKETNYPFHFLAFLTELNVVFGIEIKYLQALEKK